MRLAPALLLICCLLLACQPNTETATLNSNPVIENIIYARDAFALHEMEITCIAHDPDGDALSYRWGAEGGKFSGSGAKVEYTTPDTMGDYNLEVTVTDGKGGSDYRTFSMRILTNADGTTIPFITLNLSAARQEPVKISRTVKVGTRTKIVCVPDGTLVEDINYKWSSGGGFLKGEGMDTANCNTAFFTAPPNVRHYLVTVTAMDQNGNRAEGQVDFDFFCSPRY